MVRENEAASLFTLPCENLEEGAERGEYEERLERGQVLVMPPGFFQLPPEDDLVFLREALPKLIAFKNISYHPEGDYLTGMKGKSANRRRTSAILRDHHQTVVALLAKILPQYAENMRRGKVNFRPLEEQGRDLSVHASNERLHVDAMASGATHGDRILRFFTNIHPTQIRIWKSGGLFPQLFREFREAAGLARVDEASLRPGPARRLFSGFLHGLSRMGFPQGEMALDKSPYDKTMRRLHNFLKENEAYQADESRVVKLEFPPFHSWMVMTDMVSHAVISGRHALVNTFHVKLSDCRVPELAPYHILAQGGYDAQAGA